MKLVSEILRDTYAQSGYRLWLLLGLLLIVGLSDGLSMALLLPVLDVLGMGSDFQAGQGAAGAAFHWLFETAGIAPTLWSTSLVLIGATLIQGVSFTSQNWLLNDLQKKYVASWQNQLFSAFLAAKWSYCISQKPGEILNLILTEAPRLGAALFYTLQLIITGIVLIVYVAISLFFSWKLTLYLSGSALIVFALVHPILSATHRYGAEFESITAGVGSVLNEMLSGTKFIKASGGTAKACALVAEQLDRYRRNITWSAFLPTTIRSGFEFAGMLIILGALIYGIKIEQLSAARLLIVIGLVARLYPRLMQLQLFHSMLLLAAPAYLVLQQWRARFTAHREAQRLGARTNIDGLLPVEIRGRNISVSYDGKTVLDNVEFVLPAGKTVGFVGPSGAGKSTLVDVIMGLVEPSSGWISVGDAKLSDLDLTVWRGKIGYVSQETFLFHDTIANNIRWGDPNASMQEVRTAAGAAGLHQFICSLALEYDTVVGDRGAKLSGGQRQRISIARALVKQPVLLVLDEATSALDSISEQEVMSVFNDLNSRLTMVIVAHRLAAVRNADVIYVLDRGKIVEQGTWMELSRGRSLFRQLMNAQTLREHD